MKPRSTYFTELLEKTKKNTLVGKQLLSEPESLLRMRLNDKSWNVLDCLEHIHRSYEHYFPLLEDSLAKSSYPAEDTYRSGPFRSRLINGLMPKNGQRKLRMKTFQNMEPQTDGVPLETVFENFLKDRERLMQAIEAAQSKSLNRIKIVSAAGNWFKLRLGDCFLFLEAHDQRHLVQAQECLKTASTSK